MAYKRYGTSRGFRTLKAGQEALNQQLIADEKVIRNLETVRDQTAKRDDDLIQGLRRKFNLEDDNREANKRLEDKAYQQRLSAIQKNAQRSRQNSEIDLKNIQKEAEVWQNFSKTAVETLTAYAEHRSKQLEAEELSTVFQNPDLYQTESVLGEAVWKKLLQNTAETADLAQENGADATTVTQLATPTAPIKSVNKAKAIIALNISNYKEFLEDAIEKSGATTAADVRKIAAMAPIKFAEQLGVHKHPKLLVDYFKHAGTVNGDRISQARITENYYLGQDNIKEAVQNWELFGHNQDDSQTWLDLVSYAVKNSYDEEGKLLGRLGMKEKLGEIASNPRYIKNRAEFDAFLKLKTLPNIDADGKIKNQSITIEQLYGADGVATLWKAWEEAKDKDRLRDDKREKVYQNELYQIGLKAIVGPEAEWKGDPETLIKIFRELESKGASKETIAKLKKYTVGNDANTALNERRDHARIQIKEGNFFEDDYHMLPIQLQLEDEFKNAYVSNEALLKKIGLTGADLKTNSIQYIIKDTLGGDISISNNYSAINNLAWQEYRNDLIAEYRFNVSDKGMDYQSAWNAALDTVNDAVKEGKGKWEKKIFDNLLKADKHPTELEKHQDNYFPYFDTQDPNYRIPYPIESILNKIDTKGKKWVLSNQVISRNELRQAIENANDGFPFKPNAYLKSVAKYSDIPISELVNAQIKLLNLPGTDLFDPSLTEKATLDVKPVGNYALTTFAKDISNVEDFIKSRAAVVTPRNVNAMSSTTRWNLNAYDFGDNNPVEKFLTTEKLASFPAGQALLTKYKRPSGGWTGGAREINRRIMPDGSTKITILLPGNDPTEPHYLFLLEPGGAE